VLEGGLDPALGAYLSASDERAADELLGRWLVESAGPAIAHVVASRLAGVPEADREDVAAGVALRLTEKLRGLRAARVLEQVGEVPISSLEAYAVASAQNACRAFLRARQPHRTRLANQLRYLLRHDPALATWEDGDGRALAGLARWRGRSAGEPPPAISGLVLETPAHRIPLTELVRRLLLFRGAPWTVGDLLVALVEMRDVRDLPDVPLSAEGTDEPLDLPETRPGQHRELEDRQFLTLLWAEVRLLPRRQRVALLLNLRDAQGSDMLSLLPLTGVAGPRRIAAVLELPLDELEALWTRLPLEDREIADLLEATQRQVINLRKSARERLARRLRRHSVEPAGGSGDR
jgi:hypothetical protein